MKRTATFCALVTAALLVGACSTEPPESDTSILSHCNDNKVSTGGYWWTYRDQAQGTGADITPLTTLTFSFPMEDCDLKGKCAHVKGHVPGPFPETSTVTDLCGERLYPAAGLGFGFRANNPPYTLPADAIGISFFAKATPNAPDTTYPVRVAMPQTTTDYPQQEFSDQFAKTCQCTAEAQAVGKKKSCFANYMNENAIKLGPSWQLCAIYFTDLAVPSWAEPTIAFDRTQIIKFQLDMYQPGSTDQDIPFEVWVDEVRWIDPADTTAQPGVPPTSGCLDVAANGIVPK
ncbi:MAG: hypothetical protein JW940_16155 [Polyangiaceae bacterium]|nr:hypothetical protein [Polyangiaceae bacterium]